MNQKDLILVGGGLIAGYVICKMMNRNQISESFSANGADKGYAGQQFKWVGKQKPLIQGQQQYRTTIIPNEPFSLTGNVKKLFNQVINGNEIWTDINLIIQGGGGIPQNPTTDFYETTITKTIEDLPITPNGRTKYTRRVYVQLDSIKKI